MRRNHPTNAEHVCVADDWHCVADSVDGTREYEVPDIFGKCLSSVLGQGPVTKHSCPNLTLPFAGAIRRVHVQHHHVGNVGARCAVPRHTTSTNPDARLEGRSFSNPWLSLADYNVVACMTLAVPL